MTRRLVALATALAGLALASPARAAVPEAPMQLPGDATASAVASDPHTWIVGARPGAPAAAVARRFGARHIGPPKTGGYVLARARARAFAGVLRARGLLVYAQPNTLSAPLAVPNDPLSGPPNDWRARVADPILDPPAVTATSPLIALVDAAADMSHPEWTGDPSFATIGSPPVTIAHGTATASVAAAPANGIGILGVWPGARALNVPLPTEIRCSDSANGIAEAVQRITARGPDGRLGRGVINMSYGSRSLCEAEYVALEYAIGQGVVPVAASGNEFEEGNPLEFPASLPHVLTVAATDRADESALFSNASPAVDLSAPGQNIMTAVPPWLDTQDGAQDGYELQSGTSFAAPMVSAAVAWVEAARSTLLGDQVAQVVRRSARDVGRKGYDDLTGFGVLDVGAALTADAPPHDPLEPNENLAWVNGQAYASADPPIWNGRGPTRLAASVDVFEDPADVYRISVPAHRRARLTATPSYGDISLAVYTTAATSIYRTRGRVALSRRSGGASERITVRNTRSRARIFYVVVKPQGTRSYEAGYTLRTRE